MAFFNLKKEEKKEDQTKAKSETIEFKEINTADDVVLCNLGTKIKNGIPIILNIETLSIDEINKTIAFLSGVCYALDGYVNQIRDKVFLFGDFELYKDGSINKFLKVLDEEN